MVASYRRGRIIYWSHIQGASKEFFLCCLTHECETHRLFRNVGINLGCVTYYKSEKRICTAAVSWNHTLFFCTFPGVHRLTTLFLNCIWASPLVLYIFSVCDFCWSHSSAYEDYGVPVCDLVCSSGKWSGHFLWTLG